MKFIYTFSKNNIKNSFDISAFTYFNIINWSGIEKSNFKQIRKTTSLYVNPTYFINKFFLITMRSGNKPTVIKHFEIFFINFVHSMYFEWNEIDEKSELIKEFITPENLKYIENFVKQKKIRHNFFSIFNTLLPEYDSLFDMKIKKLPSDLRKKLNRKYTYKIEYVPFEKRIFLTLKYLKLNSFSLKNRDLNSRLFRLFFTFMLTPEKMLPWKRREIVYDILVKKYKKIH